MTEDLGGAKVYLKREDLNHTGAHKINNALGQILLGAIKNPYVLGMVMVSVWNALNDPTTAGIGDSKQAMTYDEPKNDRR